MSDDQVLRFFDGEWAQFEVHGVEWLSPGRRNVWLLMDDRAASFPTRRGATLVYEVPSMNATSVYKADAAIYALDVEHNALLKISDELTIYALSAQARQLAGDRYGNIWIATSGGLLKFDGEGFSYITSNPTYAVATDRRGNVWFSEFWYIFRYEARKDMMLKYDTGGYLPEMLAPGRNGIWFASGPSVAFVDARANETVGELDMPSDVRAIAADRYGDLWVVLADGLAKVHRADFSIEFFDVGDVYGVYVSRDLVYTKDGTTVVEGRRGTNTYLTPGMACSLSLDRRGNILVGTMDGHIYLLDFRARL